MISSTDLIWPLVLESLEFVNHGAGDVGLPGLELH